MKFRNILYILGALLFFLGLAMVFPLLWSIHYGDGDQLALILSLMLTGATGAILYLIFRPGRNDDPTLTHRDGFIIVSLGWILAGAFGSLPYLFSGILPNVVDAFFESMSGFTTTGATVLSGLDSLPRGILFWRSFTQWLGGMGIIVLSIAILPLLGVGGMQLYKAELPSRGSNKLKPRVAETARTLWLVYTILSAIEFILLLVGGMDSFNALCHTFSSMSSGGFSTSDAGVGQFGSAYIDGIITVFMFAAGVNFTLHYSLFTGNIGAVFRNSEFRFFLGVVLAATAAITFNLRFNILDDLAGCVRYASFHAVSFTTGTGFTTAEYTAWPTLSKAVLLLLMFIGGSAGSTTGSIKCLRIMLVLKHAYVELYRLVHPHAVKTVKLGTRIVYPETMASIWGFLILYLGLTLAAFLILAALGLDLLTAFSAVAATVGNVGPAFGAVSPPLTYGNLPELAKGILSFCMLAGRLEIYTLIILFVPEFWKK
ncbi:MAG: TrkH family potassium uptake protein [Syntrophales bacterium]|jgi:trk system potassium uptake protein TrkH|nr:TrkH family potassium uptake protein [Syntrophales bacterium]MCK9528472.1 TrkH family potassium uptake protein [Syntrophales bacterium]MDX9923009.1 potassium transporter TrkG [Syntrophales bacterium]